MKMTLVLLAMMAMLATVVMGQSCERILAEAEEPCSTDANNEVAPFCKYGLLCLDEQFDRCGNDEVCECQHPYREEGYIGCTVNNCDSGKCCDTGLYCTAWDTNPTCRKEGGARDPCETDNHCKRGYMCNGEDSATTTLGECVAVLSVEENGEADHPYMCKWGLVLLSGAVEICVSPDKVACTPTQTSTTCGNTNPTTNQARNPFDTFHQSTNGYCCNEDNRCELHTKKCVGIMKSIINKNSGGPRNENGLAWRTTFEKEECELLRCAADVYNLEARGASIECMDYQTGGSSSGGGSNDAAVGGAVAGTAVACSAIGGLVYWKSTQV